MSHREDDEGMMAGRAKQCLVRRRPELSLAWQPGHRAQAMAVYGVEDLGQGEAVADGEGDGS